ncbi:flavoprotein [Micromonospora sp. BRA006-A]|nr:flavoprotein [Micromonospora sp. BRA006-A]
MSGPETANGHRRVLYVIACGSPLARHVGRLVDLAQQEDWTVCVVTTPDGAKFVDRTELARQTGHPVRTHYKNRVTRTCCPGRRDAGVPGHRQHDQQVGGRHHRHPGARAAGRGAGDGVPIAAVPYTNEAMAAHPAFRASLDRLGQWGVRVVFGDHVVRLHPPGTGDRRADAFPWDAGLAALRGADRPVARSAERRDGRGPRRMPGPRPAALGVYRRGRR